MEAALAAGARLVNDVSALTFDPRASGVIAAAGVPVVLMHHQGAPETMQDDPRYDDVVVEVYLWLEERIAAAESAGIKRSSILIDPGFGFGVGRPQSRVDERPRALPFAGLSDRPRCQPQADHRSLVERGVGRPAPRRSLAFALKAVEQACRSCVPTMCRKRCRRSGSGAPSRPGFDSTGLKATTSAPAAR